MHIRSLRASLLATGLSVPLVTALPIIDAAAQQKVTIAGVVRDSSRGETLPHATVSIVDAGISVETNVDGRFVLLGVPAGSHLLQVRYLGYKPFELRIRSDSATAAPLVVNLVRAAVLIEGVEVTSNEQQTVELSAKHVGEVSISPRQVKALPSAGAVDLFRALQLLPGVSGTNDASAGLFVRRGTPDQNLVLLDGITVLQLENRDGNPNRSRSRLQRCVSDYGQQGYQRLTGRAADQRSPSLQSFAISPGSSSQ